MITIGIPFYNAELYLEDAIKSVFAQTYENWELILIDDGSSDRSLEIAKSIKDPRVKVFSDGLNKKLAARLNEIVTLAKYSIIARMDADDLMSPTRLEKQLSVLENNPTLDLVSTGVYSMTNDTRVTGLRGESHSIVSLEDLLMKRIGVVHAAILGKKEWFERNRYNVTLKTAQDYELWVRAAANNDFHISLLKEPLYYYREEGNVTIEKLHRAYKNERVLFKKYATTNRKSLILKSYSKTIIVRFLDLLNKTHVLLSKRSVNIKYDDKRIYEKELKVIHDTILPKQDLF